MNRSARRVPLGSVTDGSRLRPLTGRHLLLLRQAASARGHTQSIENVETKKEKQPLTFEDPIQAITVTPIEFLDYTGNDHPGSVSFA
jgi:hypothetical protein